MAKVSFTNLKLKTDTKTEIVKIGNAEVEVLQYLPIAEKADLISITVQQAMENGIIHPARFEQYFGLNIMYLYTNFNFTDNQKDDPDKLYDILESNGIIDLVCAAIPEEELVRLEEMIEEYTKNYITYRNSLSGAVHRIIDDLPAVVSGAQEMLKNFDINQFKEVIAFAQGANAGRPIPEGDTPVDEAFNAIGNI